MIQEPLILISNDDGYRAPGIQNLIRVARNFGEVVVVAPMTGQSGMSHAVTLNSPIRLKTVSVNGDIPTYACSGTPADCIKIALNQVLDRKPDMVLSGVNHGSNASVSLFYSGTVAAAIEACMNGIPAAALSVDDHSMEADMRVAAGEAEMVIANLLERKLPEGICLNINFPRLSPDKYKGIRICRQTSGVWREEFQKQTDPHGKDYYWLTGAFSNSEPGEVDTDEWALENGFGAVVPIRIDITALQQVEAMKKWNWTHQ